MDLSEQHERSGAPQGYYGVGVNSNKRVSAFHKGFQKNLKKLLKKELTYPNS